MTSLQTATLQKAISQLGVEEIPRGSNAGPAVEKYLKSVGLGKGYSWCMAFIYWCTKEASIEVGVLNPLSKTGGVLDMYAKEKDLRVTTPQPGDIFIMDHGKGTGHTGIVEKLVGTTLHTIEGNTNDEGSREGYEVCRRKREMKTIKGYLRL
ncbi:CHAP domain-containing protein [Flavobacterium sp. AED]|uniref:CHAP domain-containing protein n=1 Tax=Flavobacterium sp. AED TaxID=1423323 RepID=UPI0005803FF2|nr:CHAP domain-containing protein [Flavobacterium sp. AED]KIA86586.1 amidase [Flavobacterium sp. AED]